MNLKDKLEKAWRIYKGNRIFDTVRSGVYELVKGLPALAAHIPYDKTVYLNEEFAKRADPDEIAVATAHEEEHGKLDTIRPLIMWVANTLYGIPYRAYFAIEEGIVHYRVKEGLKRNNRLYNTYERLGRGYDRLSKTVKNSGLTDVIDGILGPSLPGLG